MKNFLRKSAISALSLLLVFSICACANTDLPSIFENGEKSLAELYPDAKTIKLSGDSAQLDGVQAEEFDYTWHCNPSEAHEDVKNAPAEYYTGTKPTTEADIYIDHELYYFPKLEESGFKLVNYDGEREWAYYYTDGKNDEYIFATLPNLSGKIPTDMMHTEAEAAENKVLHIKKAGTYILEGEWNGQIYIDLGDKDEIFTDENAKITVILNGVNIECSVAPGIIFYSAYECDNEWEERESHTEKVNTENAGVTVIIADGSDNTVSGKNVFRMLKTKYKDDSSTDAVKTQKKMRKTDGAFYSYVSMNIKGGEENNGKLTVNSGFEGLDSELHLSFYGGNITINSQDDGINVNEDNVSVVGFYGGNITLNAALGAEGDGVDSNGFIVIDGGNLSINGIKAPDSALDSENGVFYNSGKIVFDGKEQAYKAGDTFKESGITGGGEGRGGFEEFKPDGSNFDIKDFKEKVAALPDDATLDDVLALLGMDMFKERNPGGTPPDDMPDERPNDMPSIPQNPSGNFPRM